MDGEIPKKPKRLQCKHIYQVNTCGNVLQCAARHCACSTLYVHVHVCVCLPSAVLQCGTSCVCTARSRCDGSDLFRPMPLWAIWPEQAWRGGAWNRRGVFVGSRSSLVQLRKPLRLVCWSSAEDMGWTVTRLNGISTTQGYEGVRDRL